jgi:hypothetical protein
MRLARGFRCSRGNKQARFSDLSRGRGFRSRNQTFCDGCHIRGVTRITAAAWSMSDNR